jgi:hypothetical protein
MEPVETLPGVVLFNAAMVRGLIQGARLTDNIDDALAILEQIDDHMSALYGAADQARTEVKERASIRRLPKEV